MAKDVKKVILVTKDALLLCHKNCGEHKNTVEHC